ncbi:MAG: Ig-like domain-containing protein, partial [Halobacteriales archaeon]|nr:Ig-like domain-containing protein [Halobacteriales archaeon]
VVGVEDVDYLTVAVVQMSTDAVQIAVGESLQLEVKAYNRQGKEIAGPPTSYSWTSSHPDVATVDDQGVVTGVSGGMATITSSKGGKSASTQAEVMEAAAVEGSVASVTVEPDALDLEVGQSQQLTASALDDAGGSITTSNADYVWSSSNDGVATVSETGAVTAMSDGTATITASLEGKSGTANVTVSPTADTAPLTLDVPSSIPADCSVDATAELNTFLEGVGDGSTVTFPSGACYKTVGAVVVSGKTDVTIEGSGARFVRTELSPQELRYPGRNPYIRVVDGTRVVLRDVVVEGTNNGSDYGGYVLDANGESQVVDCLSYLPDYGCYTIALEFEHAVEVLGSVETTVEGLTASDIWGDGVYVAGRDQFTSQQGEFVTLTNITVDRNGRQGIAVNRIQNVLIDGFVLTRGRRSGVDIEPDAGSEQIRFIEIRNSTIETNLLAFASYGRGESSDVYIHHNVITKTGVPWVYVAANDGTKRYNWRIEDNEVQQQLGSPAPGLRFVNVEGVEVRRNVNQYAPDQPTDAVGLLSGSTAVVECNWFEDAAAVVVDDGTATWTESNNTTGSTAPTGCGSA